MEGRSAAAGSRAELKARRVSPARTWRGADVARQIVVIVAVCVALLTGFLGSGRVGPGAGVGDAQGGALAPDATLLAPGRPAFAIWIVVYLGLVAYAVWQALPAQRAAERQRAVGWWIALTALLDGVWVLTARWGALWMTVVVIVVLLAVLALTFRRAVLTAHPGSSWLDLVLVDGVTGLHVGWVTLATVANVAAWLSTLGVWNDGDQWWAAGVLALVLVAGLVVSGLSGWRVAPPWAMAWGATWIGVERLAGDPASTLVGWTALAVAAALFAVPFVLRLAVALRAGD